MFDEDEFWRRLDDWVLWQVALDRHDEPEESWDDFLAAIGDDDAD